MHAIIIRVTDYGYCFARINGTRRKVFCHAESFAPPLEFGEHLEGERVDVTTYETPNGLRASSVEPFRFEG